jgi:hypothetical protein
MTAAEVGGSALLAAALGLQGLRWPLERLLAIASFASVVLTGYYGLATLPHVPWAGAFLLASAAAGVAGRLGARRTAWWCFGSVVAVAGVVTILVSLRVADASSFGVSLTVASPSALLAAASIAAPIRSRPRRQATRTDSSGPAAS